MEREVITRMNEGELRAMIYNCVLKALDNHKKALKNNPHLNNRSHLTIQQTRERLQCSKSTVHKLIREGKLKFAKIGRKTLIEEASIDLFLKEQTPDISK